MIGVIMVECPSKFEPELSHLMHSGAPDLLRNCYVCSFYGGETETEIFCSYPSLRIKKEVVEENMYLSDFDDDAEIIPSSLLSATSPNSKLTETKE